MAEQGTEFRIAETFENRPGQDDVGFLRYVIERGVTAAAVVGPLIDDDGHALRCRASAAVRAAA